jgi:D-isomer specific 2-hydroxyacid dehydrogenase, NAD binding domain
MNIGILDCKVGSTFIEEVERYRERGYDVINAGALDTPRKNYDILASTWTQLSARRLGNVCCRAVVVKDNDEPFNVIHQKTVEQLKIPVQLINNWGISTRVAWNLEQIARYAPDLKNILIIADTPSHDAIAKEFSSDDVFCEKCPVKDGQLTRRTLLEYDVVIVHLSKNDFSKQWFDQFLKQGIAQRLLISTTRGALFSAAAMNVAVMNGTPQTAVLDWVWQRDGLANHLISDNRIVLTNHTSYQSPQSRRELTDVTIEAVEKLKAQL